MNFEVVERGFQRLTAQANLSANEILQVTQRASKGTINNYNLMLAANKALALGVVTSASEIETLLEIARLKGQAFGLSTTQAFDDIVTGLGRGSKLILDNLGIVINTTEANEKYAQSIGKVASQLTDAEKKQALINAVVSEGRAELDFA